MSEIICQIELRVVFPRDAISISTGLGVGIRTELAQNMQTVRNNYSIIGHLISLLIELSKLLIPRKVIVKNMYTIVTPVAALPNRPSVTCPGLECAIIGMCVANSKTHAQH